MHLTLQTDGGARGNPGPAAYGFVLLDDAGAVVEQRGELMGETTNNHAEYQALIEGLTAAERLGATEVSVQADSELVIKQMRGEYRIKHPNMKQLASEVQALARRFTRVGYAHIRREQNARADALVNAALDGAGFTKAPPPPRRGSLFD